MKHDSYIYNIFSTRLIFRKTDFDVPSCIFIYITFLRVILALLIFRIVFLSKCIGNKTLANIPSHIFLPAWHIKPVLGRLLCSSDYHDYFHSFFYFFILFFWPGIQIEFFVNKLLLKLKTMLFYIQIPVFSPPSPPKPPTNP